MAYRGELSNLEQPSFGERLGLGLGGAGQAAGQGIVDYYQRQKQEAQADKAADFISQLTGLDKEMVKKMSPEDRKEAFKYAQNYGIEKLKQEGKVSQPTKEEVKAQEKQASAMRAQETIGNLRDLIEEGNVGAQAYAQSYLPWASAAKEGVAEFDSMVGGLESSLVEMVNRGTLSNTRFKYITETLLPKSSDTVATIQGKLKGLEEILVNQHLGEDGEKEEVEVKEKGKGKELTEEIFMKAYNEMGQDPEKTRKHLKKMGYNVNA